MAKKVKETLLNEKKKFLVFAAHPDDFDFSCAATIARLTDEGHKVVYCVMTNGEKGTHALKLSRKEMEKQREQEQCAAGECVGVKEVIFLRHVDGELEHTKKICESVTKIIREVKPDIILSFDPANRLFDSFGRFHRDHRMAAEIIFDAIYPAAGSDAYCTELAEKGIPPHQIEEVWFFSTDKPNLFVDITNHIDKKIAALRAHTSQIPDVSEMEKKMYDRAAHMARESGMSGVTHAESFRRLAF